MKKANSKTGLLAKTPNKKLSKASTNHQMLSDKLVLRNTWSDYTKLVFRTLTKAQGRRFKSSRRSGVDFGLV